MEKVEKRSVNIFGGCKYRESCKKRATLLYIGRLMIQNIYYNLSGAHAAEDHGTANVNTAPSQKLNEYFAPNQSRVYERYVFRQITLKEFQLRW